MFSDTTELTVTQIIECRVDADSQVGSNYPGNADHIWAFPLFGQKRAHHLLLPRKVYYASVNATLSCGWNVNPLNPLAGIANAVKLKDKGLANVRTSAEAYIINAVNALELESVTGSVAVGKSPDLLVLDRESMDRSPIHQQSEHIGVSISVLL